MATKNVENKTQGKEMVRVFALWKNKSKDGKAFLSGKREDGTKLVGFFSGKKKNPKEPDLRVYTVDENGNLNKDKVVSMWANASSNGNKYLTGKIGDKRIVGFIRKNDNEKAPYLNVYLSEDREGYKKKVEAEQVEFETPEDLELPF